ncbi:exopolysaccharide biosynthesis protein [Paracoccus sp. WLY502]|uniref:exopolysaccharide biosynthesis protein n=1 Tax=Paracoccus yibinensis TaxID=3068891 RepID=UPI002796C190|nr:exopolysaccharide biosynthesis protein [Paracoccus sp. WLY502]MDQ1901792.1 exopolysaccharide biosynthesis protein [Paracoccus sp. WLY502]
MQDKETIQPLLDAAGNASDDRKTSVGQIVESLGENSLTPNLIFVALAVVSPLSGVPLFSSICGITIALISAQMLVGRNHIWLPGFVMSRQIDSDKLDRALKALRRPARWLDRITRPRLTFLVRGPVRKLTQALCMICGLAMPLLEIVPFTSSILGTVVSLLAFGMLARDGLFTLLGLAFLLALGGGVLWFLQ